ncbi:MAG: pyruvate kinase [bacterium]
MAKRVITHTKTVERRTKIVATIGPASRGREMLARLVEEGLDVARINASHGTHVDHRTAILRLRALERRMRKPIGLLVDLQGPKIRIGTLAQGAPVELVAGKTVVIEPGHFPGTAARLSTTYRNLPKDVTRGDAILLDDGLLRLRVTRVRAGAVESEVVVGGTLKEHKGVNLPGARVSAPSMTRKDYADLAFGLANGADYIALSFVRSGSDVRVLRRAIARHGGRAAIIAKIEKPDALDRIDEILREADGIMVARGDLGVELAPEKVPAAQKALIHKANAAERIVITATQMLESMIVSPVPTRAEASDVANAIFDGTDAVMLSAETASGRYPALAVRMMAGIAREAEAHGEFDSREDASLALGSPEHAMARAACSAALGARVRTIVVLTLSGRTALTLSKMKPPARIVAVAASLAVASRMALYRGVVPMVMPLASTTDRMIANADRALVRRHLAARGESVILVAGVTQAIGATNMIKLHRVGIG